MKERPILLNTDMVKAVLNGRKTQTRRPVDKRLIDHFIWVGSSNDDNSEFDFLGLTYGQWKDDKDKEHKPEWLIYCTEYPEEGVIPIGQGHGAVGDRLWVRETFAALDAGSYEQAKPTEGMNQDIRYKATEKLANQDADIRGFGWKPSIHMPRWACRIVLEIAGVRIERVKDITEKDARKEGFSNRSEFSELWENLYPGSWDENGWVWVIDFVISKETSK